MTRDLHYGDIRASGTVQVSAYTVAKGRPKSDDDTVEESAPWATHLYQEMAGTCTSFLWYGRHSAAPYRGRVGTAANEAARTSQDSKKRGSTARI